MFRAMGVALIFSAFLGLYTLHSIFILSSHKEQRMYDFYSDILENVSGSGRTETGTVSNGGNTLTGVYFFSEKFVSGKGTEKIRVFIPKITVSSTGTVTEADAIFDALNFQKYNQRTSSGYTSLLFAKNDKTGFERRLFLNKLYLFCKDANSNGNCDGYDVLNGNGDDSFTIR